MASDPVIIKPPTALVYSDSIDTTNLTNVLIIDSTITDNKELYDSANANTFPIIYSYNSKTDDLLALLRQKFPASSIQRIALVFHDRGGNYAVPFMNNKSLFDDSDLIENQTSFTENVSFLIECIKEFNVANIDFLACNTLKYSNWKSYYSLLVAHTSVVVGASNDATGNVQYGGDWVMESTGEDIKQTYFTDSIDYYKYLLDTYTLNSIVYTFTIGNPSAGVTGFVSGITTANIPLTIDVSGNTYNVTSIGANAFQNCTTLTSVTIPDSVASIASFAFYNCTALVSATLPTNVAYTTIVGGTFQYCSSLTSITIPDYVTSIQDNAFFTCSSLTSVSISNFVTFIGIGVFAYCTKVTGFVVGSSNPNYTSDASGVLFNKAQSILMQYPAGNTQTTYNIPISVTTISNYAFTNCANLTSISIPSLVEIIGNFAFQNCTLLTSVSIPDPVTIIRINTFDNCRSLTSVTMPTNLSFRTIENYAFRNCILLTSVSIPNSVRTFGIEVFYGCTSLNSVTLPINSLFTTITTGTFYICTSLTSISIPNSVITIQEGAFYGCILLSSVTLPIDASFTTISFNAFFSCKSLTSILIPNSVITIGNVAFGDCISLTSVSIPQSVTTIGTDPFRDCTSLTAIAVDISNNNYSNDAYGVLFNKNQSTLIQYPVGNTRTTYNAPISVTSVSRFAFSRCSSLTYVKLSTNPLFTTIGVAAFYFCTSLTSISIPNSATSIGSTAFQNCTSLTSISIPNSVTTIESSAFQSCTKLNLVYFLQTSSIPTIGTNAFRLISVSSVGKYYSGVANTSRIAPPVFSSISPIDNIIPTLNVMSPFTGYVNPLSVISYTDLSGNGNEAVVNPPFVFLVQSLTTGLLSIGATQATATPWDASNNLINGSINAYWTYETDASGVVDAFTVIVQDAVGNVSSPNVQVPVNLCFKKGTKILCENGVYILIEELKIGDLVKTYKHGYQKIIMTAHSSLYYDSQNILDKLYTYSRESNPDLIEDLHLTGGHSLLVDGLTEEESANMKQIPWPDEEFMIEDKYKLLACFSSELCIAAKQNVEIYHFTLEPPENTKPTHVYGIYANGILAESCSQGAMEEALKKNNMLHDSCGSS